MSVGTHRASPPCAWIIATGASLSGPRRAATMSHRLDMLRIIAYVHTFVMTRGNLHPLGHTHAWVLCRASSLPPVRFLITPLMSILHSLFVREGGCKSSADAAAPR